jgi:hypothetical protein
MRENNRDGMVIKRLIVWKIAGSNKINGLRMLGSGAGIICYRVFAHLEK